MIYFHKNFVCKSLHELNFFYQFFFIRHFKYLKLWSNHSVYYSRPLEQFLSNLFIFNGEIIKFSFKKVNTIVDRFPFVFVSLFCPTLILFFFKNKQYHSEVLSFSSYWKGVECSLNNKFALISKLCHTLIIVIQFKIVSHSL